MQMIDVITKLREIAERSPEEIGRAIAAAEAMTGARVTEAAKPDFLDVNKDGDKKEPMKKALKDKENKKVDEEAKVDEDDMEEGNEFSGELAKAKAAGKDEFEVDGKTYKVKESVSEDVQITLSGSDAVLAEILKLAGMIGAKTIKGAEAAPPTPPAMPSPMGGMPSSGPVPSLAAMLGDAPDMGSEPMMDGAYDASTTPDPFTMDASAAVPSGNDLAKPKITTPMTSPGNNPMHTSVSFD